MDRPTCKTCAYYESNSGICCRHPPTQFLRDIDKEDREEWVQCSSPEMMDDEFCGEHQNFGEYIMSRMETATPKCDGCNNRL
jgi:hypothetical protein